MLRVQLIVSLLFIYILKIGIVRSVICPRRVLIRFV